MNTTSKKSAGFTLIEVVVAVSVLAIGLLGLASLQATAMKLNSSALLRSQATNLASSILDAMRVNLTAAKAHGYDTLCNTMTTPPSCTSSSSTPLSLSGSIANQDCAAWNNALACTFTQGQGSVSVTGSGPFTVTITIQWNSDRNLISGQSSAAQTYQMVSYL